MVSATEEARDMAFLTAVSPKTNDKKVPLVKNVRLQIDGCFFHCFRNTQLLV